ncbi:hypothetical protein A2U01_0001944 [Trifolium medium]|uniref:Uncharacterized protein n=1 Tax=Trifolium medium TaxID=97028 RepID=A0A392M1F2_9FABA|nr:hypothetical protein [Trifolium medium]
MISMKNGNLNCTATDLAVLPQLIHQQGWFYGQKVAKSFGFVKPTRVELEYKIQKNEFAMTLIPKLESVQSNQLPEVRVISSSSDESDEETDVLENESSDNESCLSTEVLDEADDDEEENGEEPLEIHTWDKIVTRAMANPRKKQHFLNHISRGVLANTYEIHLMSEDTEFDFHCDIHSSDRTADKGYYEKHIGDGWYQYMIHTGQGLVTN